MLEKRKWSAIKEDFIARVSDIALRYLLWLCSRKRGGERTKRNKYFNLNQNEKKILNWPQGKQKKKKVHLILCSPRLMHSSIAILCVLVQCTDVSVISSCCWRALESEFHIKKWRCFDIDREHWANSTLPHNAKSLHSSWQHMAIPWQCTNKEGVNEHFIGRLHSQKVRIHGRRKSQEQRNWASGCSMNTVWAADWSMSRQLWLCAVAAMQS